MTKIVSLSDRAYSELKNRKGKDESFSDVVLRIIEGRSAGSPLKFFGAWSGEEFERISKDLKRQREATRSRDYRL